MMNKFFITALAVLCTFTASAQKADAILSKWLSNTGEGQVYTPARTYG